MEHSTSSSRRFWTTPQSVRAGTISLPLFIIVLLVVYMYTDALDPLLMTEVAIGPFAIYTAYLSTRKPLIEITPEEIRYRDGHASKFSSIQLPEVAGIEWLGHDNIGLRLRSGEVRTVSIIELRLDRREEVRAAIRETLERKNSPIGQ